MKATEIAENAKKMYEVKSGLPTGYTFEDWLFAQAKEDLAQTYKIRHVKDIGIDYSPDVFFDDMLGFRIDFGVLHSELGLFKEINQKFNKINTILTKTCESFEPLKENFFQRRCILHVLKSTNKSINDKFKLYLDDKFAEGIPEVNENFHSIREWFIAYYHNT
jgi:hypothetical protein